MHFATFLYKFLTSFLIVLSIDISSPTIAITICVALKDNSNKFLLLPFGARKISDYMGSKREKSNNFSSLLLLSFRNYDFIWIIKTIINRRSLFFYCLFCLKENENEIEVEVERQGKYIVTFDPLDGSSNIDCLVSIGKVIYR